MQEPPTVIDSRVVCILVGEVQVGKTTIITQESNLPISAYYNQTIGVDFSICRYTIEHYRVKAIIWDSSGSPRFRYSILDHFPRDSAVMFVYSLSDRSSFQAVTDWHAAVQRVAGKFTAILVGNKADCERSVTCEEGMELGTRLKMPFLEVSAHEKSGVGDTYIRCY